MSKKLTIEISDDLANFAQAKVAAGDYASVDEAVAAGVRNLQEHDAMIDRWLRDEVMPTYERWKAGLEKTYTADEVFDKLENRIRERGARKKAS